MDRNDIEEMAKDLIPQAEESNAGQVLMTADYDRSGSSSWVSARKRSIGRKDSVYEDSKLEHQRK